MAVEAYPWIPARQELPPDGLIVMTKIDDPAGVRNEATLKRSGRLWFIPDGSVYVYYAPTHWRYLNAARDAGMREGR